MKTLTIITVLAEGEKVEKVKHGFDGWESVEHLIYLDPSNICGKVALKNHYLAGVKTTHILWLEADSKLAGSLAHRTSLPKNLEEVHGRVTALLVETEAQKQNPWRGMPAGDYDMMMRLGDSCRALCQGPHSAEWLLSKTTMQEAVVAKDTGFLDRRLSSLTRRSADVLGLPSP
jgi:hypothetical protein